MQMKVKCTAVDRPGLLIEYTLFYSFSRSYCYTYSMIGYIGIILLSVRLSVCLWRCALWTSGLVDTAKSCTSVFLAGMFLYLSFQTLLL